MTLTTLQEAHGGPDTSYYGDRGHWPIVLTKTRGANVLDKANWDAALDLLQPRGPGMIGNQSADDYAIESSSHWLVGHVDFLIVRPGTKAYEIAQCIQASLDDYPVLDDELHSQYEHDATDKLWRMIDTDERIQYLQKNGDSVFAARCKDAYSLYQRAESTYYDLESLATE